MRTHGAVVGRRFRSITKLTTKVRIGRGYLWGSFLIAAAALKTPTRNGYNAQGVNLNCLIVFIFWYVSGPLGRLPYRPLLVGILRLLPAHRAVYAYMYGYTYVCAVLLMLQRRTPLSSFLLGALG